MSVLGSMSQISSVVPHLPLSWYADPAIEALEREKLFRFGPNYVGHELMVPEGGDYFSLPWRDHGQVLVNNGQSVELLSNVCRHRQAIMLEGRGKAQNIVCPLHRWTYDLTGKLAGAPHFPQQPCLDLEQAHLSRWNGLLFEGGFPVGEELVRSRAAQDLDFTGYQLDSVKTFQHRFNWKTFIEVYLEDYHVVPFHPGLSGFVNCDDLRWEFGAWHSVQTVGLKDHLRRAGSPVYQHWHEVVRRYSGDREPVNGAIWMVLYPNIMVEWYPHVLVVSTVWPDGPQRCTNVVEFYYPEEIILFEREFVEAQQQAYFETAREDDEICERMDRGRRALMARGCEEGGPYQSPMEDGMLHFHEFLRRQLGT
ncbi:MAG: aromatic ring-hydroxylating dioxygenase subunit alpha [Ferrovum sp.]|nr:aromatic ring-hydroxylating dioxygenase subunit alpha [Ferrovum sp.]NDU86755.1 aromatic ring-hydroxylating dioxygenase subunit alpha [Ferrovum sp.]